MTKLGILLQALDGAVVHGNAEQTCSGIGCDSRQVRPGDIFVAIPGAISDGNAFIPEAIARGAVAVVQQHPPPARLDTRVTFVQVVDARMALAGLAAAFYGHPSRALPVVGITGTNGKTTAAFMMREILAAAGQKVGLIGTIHYRIGDRILPASRTTPDAVQVQRLLAEMRDTGCSAAMMEVSSHALEQKRVHHMDFSVVVFTNLTAEHLDYHGTMDAYFDAKARLFDGVHDAAARAVINVDDAWGQQLVARANRPDKVVTYGTSESATLRASRIAISASGTQFELEADGRRMTVHLSLLGTFNVYNALAALGACRELGVELDEASRVLSGMPPVPGRLEPVETSRDFHVYVDYAHTDDALKHALQALRPLTRGRLLVVFGCGGDRDREKRPRMGRVASELADRVFLTSDNPRTEDPQRILKEIEQGMSGPADVEVLADRKAAIQRALQCAEEGDVVLVAGKGHENVQELQQTVVLFNDRQVVREVLAEGS